MIDITDKKMLEHKFAENFASPYYPILANMYLLDGDVPRASKVCEIGLDHDSTNIDGKFVFAKVAFAEEKFVKAEKWLKRVVADNPFHFNALRMLIKLEFQLNRSPNTIKNYINQLLKFIPDDAECLGWTNKIRDSESLPESDDNSLSVVSDIETKGGNDVPIKTLEPVADKTYKIVESMATFTMVQVLKSQQHYSQALAVLDVLESKGRDGDRIAQEKDQILQLITES